MLTLYSAHSLFSNDPHGCQTLPGLTNLPNKICLFVQYVIDEEQDWHLENVSHLCNRKGLPAKSGHLKQLDFLSWQTKTEVVFTVQC